MQQNGSTYNLLSPLTADPQTDATHVELGAAALEAVGLVHDQHVPLHLAAQQRRHVLADAQLWRRHHHRRLPQPLAL